MVAATPTSKNYTTANLYWSDADLKSVSGGINALDSASTGLNNTAIGWNAGADITTGSNNTILGPYAGSAALESNVVVADGAGVARFSSDASSTMTVPAGIVLKSYTVAGLATYAALNPAPVAGTVAFVTDSNQTLAANGGATVTGGGSAKFPVYYDGAAWKVG